MSSGRWSPFDAPQAMTSLLHLNWSTFCSVCVKKKSLLEDNVTPVDI
jgi:hypothetical protein